jgi:hypothetical protein
MSDLFTPVVSDPRFRVQETGSDSRLRQSDSSSDKEKQGKKRSKNRSQSDDTYFVKGENAHSLDLLA